MRPLTPVTDSTGARLIGAHGAYCAICERPVPAEFWLLNTATGAVLEADTPSAPSSLICCHDCVTHHKGGKLDGLALPHRDTTFALGDASAFKYATEPATVIQLGADGKQVSETKDLVFVTGTTTQAKATVEHFALNSAYLRGAGRILTIPWAHHSPDLDRRIFLRTEAWQRAEQLVEPLTSGGGTLRAMARDLIAAAGFWSVFATVLHARTADRELVAELLLPATVRRRPGHFPGTRGDPL